MFSRRFPAYHPKAGQPTYFVEKIWKYLKVSGQEEKINKALFSQEFALKSEGPFSSITPKFQTIRRGFRWNENDIFSPRIWSGPPYRSKHVPIASDLQVKKVWNMIILPNQEVFIQGQLYGFYGSQEIEKLAYHDGLEYEDFKYWFRPLPFEGQVICWDANVEYLTGS